MKKMFSKTTALIALVLAIAFIVFPMGSVSAQMADGTHKVGYEIQEAGGGSVSIADGYFSKPATLTVKDGVQTIQLTVTSSDMIKSLSVQGTPVQVVSDSGDTRVVKFNVSDASKPVNMDMHVVVPDLYDTEHGAQAIFNVSGVPALADEPAAESDDDGEPSSNDDGAATEGSSDIGTGEEVENPPTGDETPIALYIGLLVGSIVLFSVYKFRFARN